MNNTMMAIYYEHKQRTGHDVFVQKEFGTLHIRCEVCMYIHSEKRDCDKAEREYYEQQKRQDEIESECANPND